MSEIIEKTEVVLSLELGITPQEFAELWNQDPEYSRSAFATVRQGRAPTSMGEFELVKYVIELIPEPGQVFHLAQEMADVTVKATAGVAIKELITKFFQNRKEAKEREKKASTEFDRLFFSVSEEDHKRRKTFFVNGKLN